MQKKTIRQKFDNLSRWNTQQATNNKLYQHQHNKCHYEKSTAMGKEWKTFSSEVKKKARMHTLHYSSTETLTEIIWEKEIKGQQIEKEGNLSSFPRDKVS